ncbi:unnamed protein product [Ectocarpus sp. CCAP 1310/34]|nr:unnamed protein product [Ectocarpus sp. CCAP 1310/34]
MTSTALPRRSVHQPLGKEVMTDIFLTSTAALSAKSSLFIAWGQLLTYDLALTVANETESLDVPCNDADQNGGIDVWCPLGAASEDIPFSRSDAAEGTDGVRSPINYASSYIDLDFVYGRSAEAAELLRTMEGGFMNVTDSGVPFQNEDGTWLVSVGERQAARQRETLVRLCGPSVLSFLLMRLTRACIAFLVFCVE